MPKLSKREYQEAIAERYNGKDLYAPGNDPKQQPAHFKPQDITGEPCDVCNEHHIPGMCEGGDVRDVKMSKGGPVKLADGGETIGPANNQPEGNLSAGNSGWIGAPDAAPDPTSPDLSVTPENFTPQTSTGNLADLLAQAQAAKPPSYTASPILGNVKPGWGQSLVPDPEADQNQVASSDFKDGLANVQNLPDGSVPQKTNQAKNITAKSAAASTPAAPATASKNSLGMEPDQFNELMQYLERGPSTQQRVGNVLSTLGSGIIQGVARAGNPGFMENQQAQQQARNAMLLEALKSKYEKQFQQGSLNLNIGKTRANIINQQQERDQAGNAQELTRTKNNMDAANQVLAAARAATGILPGAEREIGVGAPLPTPAAIAWAQYVQSHNGQTPLGQENAPSEYQTTPKGVKYTVSK